MTQTILITGANRGIGLALTKQFLSNGETVIATCRVPDRAETLQTLTKETANLTILSLDVADENSIAALSSTLNDQPLDVLINNAGILSGTNPHASVLDKAPDQTLGSINSEGWVKVLRTNSIAPVMVTQALLPNLRRGQTRKIVMISSRWGAITHMDSTIPLAYGTSKAALNAATKIISSTLQNEQFVVVTLNPGAVRTDMGSQEADLAPEESARRLVKIINALTPEQTGQFLRHTGENIAW
ncbi:MAG: SDR family oxidoreductase [Alphaproteobacteria bacterium]|nr:SDR family oxidoreductase [Alphaproteobacteria bacterium]